MKQAYDFFKDNQNTLPAYSWFMPDKEDQFPDYAPDDIRWTPAQFRGKNEAEILKELVRKGMNEKGFTGKPEYEARLEHELSVILGKNFERYFLIVFDIMWYCRRQNIEYGIARGSGASSLVGHCLKITGVDPLKYNLLFERFLDPERDDAPDYDLDIQDTRRADVKRYLENKYGLDHVAGITTFGTYKPKSAFKAACRVMGVPYKESEEGVALITDDDSDSDLQKDIPLYSKYPGLKDIALGLYGHISNTGRHAAGVVVADKPLTEYVSIETRSLPGVDKRETVVAADKYSAEQIGLVKIDLLGLKSLSIVSDAVANIKEKMIDWKNLTEDDPEVFDMLSKGNTSGVFQAEESASTKLILEMGVHNFDDLVTSNALVRSGAYNAFGKDYIAVKKGHKRPHYPTPESRDFLSDSHGFCVMQEQTMLLIQKVAGMTVAESNQIRRLTAKKKDKSTLAPFKDKFVKGCQSNGVSLKEAEKLWTDIETTAEYQFNKCLVGETVIITKEHGEITVAEAKSKLDNGETLHVSGPDSIGKFKAENMGDPTWHKIEEVIDSGEQETVSIWLDSKTEIVSSFNHRHRLVNRWKEARRIHKNDVIWTIDGKQRVAGRKYMGIQQTYDVVLATEPHAFYANGFVTHNSHAVSYSKLSYAMAYLKRYYPGQFMAAVLKHEKDMGNISGYLAECKRLDIPVNTPDVNKSEIDYAFKDGQIYMGLSAIKYVSDKTAERIIAARPFNSKQELLDFHKTKNSGVNKRVIESIAAVGALRTPDTNYNESKVRSNYFEYLGMPSFGGIELTETMQKQVTRLEDFKDGIAIVRGIVQDITSKSTWNRIGVVDETGQGTFFINNIDGVKKGERYLFLVDGNSVVDKMNLNDYDTSHPLVRYMNGDMSENIWVVGGSFRTTKAGKPMATIVYSYNNVLKSFMSVGDKVAKIKSECKRGTRIKLALSKDGKWLEDVKRYE